MLCYHQKNAAVLFIHSWGSCLSRSVRVREATQKMVCDSLSTDCIFKWCIHRFARYKYSSKMFFSWFFYFEDFPFLYYSSKSANVFRMFVWHIYPAPRLHGCGIGIGWDEMNAIIYPSNHNLCTGACREQDLPSSNIFDKWKESDLRELFSKNRLTIFIFHCWNKILLLKKYQVDTFMV